MKDTNPKDAIGDTKVPLWLCSPIAMVHWAVAQFAGMIKYGAWNWRSAGIRTSIYISALKRHIESYESGEDYDPVDGTHHLGNVMAGAAILLEATHTGKLNDDRPPATADIRMVYLEGEHIMQRLREQYKDRKPRHFTIADTKEIVDAALSSKVVKQDRRDRGQRTELGESSTLSREEIYARLKRARSAGR